MWRTRVTIVAMETRQLFIFIVSDVDVAVNNIRVFIVAMWIQRWVHYALLSNYKLFLTSVNYHNYYIFWMCICIFILIIRHENRILSVPCCIVVCNLSGSAIFSHLLINGTIFGKKLLNMKCSFWFSLRHFYETFLILRII